jgi:hypothetical protein
VTSRRSATLLLAASLASGCRACRGVEVDGLWVGAVDAPRIEWIDPSGAGTDVVPAPPDAPVRALLALRNGFPGGLKGGIVLVLQEPEACAGGTLDPGTGACVPAGATRRAVPPGFFIDVSSTERLAALAAVDASGAPLFTFAEPPWAAAQDLSGRVWVTGRTAPVVYGLDGSVVLAPDPLPLPTRGIAVLADGRVVVSYGVQDLAVYGADGTVSESISTDLGPDLQGIDALLGRPDGTLLLGSERFGVTSSGVVLAARLDPGALTLLVDPAQCPTLAGGLPSAIGAGYGMYFTGPPLGRLAPPQCGQWLSADLRRAGGCIAPEPHRGAAWVVERDSAP